jgi:hypothetical protein
LLFIMFGLDDIMNRGVVNNPWSKDENVVYCFSPWLL